MYKKTMAMKSTYDIENIRKGTPRGQHEIMRKEWLCSKTVMWLTLQLG